MASILSKAALAGLLLGSISASYLSITSSRLLMEYEDMTKKAAKYSNEAERQLWKTRKTQGSAVVAILTSALSAAYLLLTSSNDTKSNAICGLNAITCTLVWRYVSGFWAHSARVPLPGSGKYNDAVRNTEQVMLFLRGLGVGWGVLLLAKVGLKV